MTPTSEDMIPVEEYTAEPAAESIDAAPDAEASLAEDPAETEEAESPKPPRFQKLKRFVSALFVPENAMRLAFFLGPFAAYLMVEYLNGNDPFTSHLPGQVFFNLVWYGIIFWVMRMIIGRKGLSAAVSAQNTNALSGRDGQINSLQNLLGAVFLVYIFDFNGHGKTVLSKSSRNRWLFPRKKPYNKAWR